MTEMTKKERLEHTRSLIRANYICRLYDSIGRKMENEKMIEYEICKRCGVKRIKFLMHFSIMYHGFICNNSEECLKRKEKK